MQVIPAILPHSIDEVYEKTERIRGFCSFVQIDICDGVFGREKTWIPEEGDPLPEGFMYEFDVMVNDWKQCIPRCVTLGAKKIVAHVDQFIDGDMDALVEILQSHSIDLGIAVSNDASIDFHADMIRQAKEKYAHVYIQVMGIRNIGEQGQFFDEDSLERIRALKKIFGDTPIQVDGGMKPDTVKRVADAGASTVVVGSYLFGEGDPALSYSELLSIENKSGC